MYARIRAALAAPDRFKRLIDFFLGHLLYALPARWRRRLFSGEAHFCPLCDSRLRIFLRLHRQFHLYCPVCGSLQRHRLVWLFFNSRYVQPGLKARRMLHIAPEPALARKFRQLPGLDYLSADLHDRSAMVKMDISAINMPDGSFDMIYCSHVLEHVSDDRRAMKEFFRLLRPEGWAVIIVPLFSEKTFEDQTITGPEERQKAFGQHDHVRSYGPDIKERLEQAGFMVRLVETSDLADPEQARRLGLDNEEKIFYCRKELHY